jgi:hypothetical protein
MTRVKEDDPSGIVPIREYVLSCNETRWPWYGDIAPACWLLQIRLLAKAKLLRGRETRRVRIELLGLATMVDSKTNIIHLW